MKRCLADKVLKIHFKYSGFQEGDHANFWMPIHSKANTKPKNDIVIEVNKGNKGFSYIKDIIHELIHAKQYLTGRILYVRAPQKRGQYVYWKFNKLSKKLDKISYLARPWEREARRLEEYYWKKYRG